jgi:hypothetical protein
MTRFVPAAFFLTGAIALGLAAGKQAQLLSDAPTARTSSPAAAAGFVFFAGTSAALLTVGAASAADRWEA